MKTFSIICLVVSAIFVYLWHRTSPDSTYVTDEGDIVSTKKVFFILALVSFGFFLFSLFLKN
jgi:hypothetical protein